MCLLQLSAREALGYSPTQRTVGGSSSALTSERFRRFAHLARSSTLTVEFVTTCPTPGKDTEREGELTLVSYGRVHGPWSASWRKWSELNLHRTSLQRSDRLGFAVWILVREQSMNSAPLFVNLIVHDFFLSMLSVKMAFSPTVLERSCLSTIRIQNLGFKIVHIFQILRNHFTEQVDVIPTIYLLTAWVWCFLISYNKNINKQLMKS